MATRQKRQLQLTAFELVMIAASFVVTVTAVFFLGLYVGKTNASHHAPVEDRVARVPVDDFTKYKRPAPIEKPVKAPPAEEPVAAEPVAEPAKPAAEPLKASAPPSVASETAPPAPAAAPAVPVVVSEDAKAKTDAAADAAAKDAAAKEAAKAKELAAAREKEKEKEKEKAKEEEKDTGRGYTVQILSTRKQADADALVKKLKSSGYAAYIKKVSEGEGAWYRVRVGSYGAFNEARSMADKCRRDLGLGQAFVSTE